MLFYEKTISEIEHGPKTLMNASDSIKKDDGLGRSKYLADENFWIHKGYSTDDVTISGTNGSSIQSKLIEMVGRYTESYGCDLIIILSDLQPFLTAKDCPFEDDRWVIGVGIRENGVDYNRAILNNLKDTRHGFYDYVYPNYNYRKILVIDIQDKVEDDGLSVQRMIALKDVTNDIIRIDPEDEDGKEA